MGPTETRIKPLKSRSTFWTESILFPDKIIPSSYLCFYLVKYTNHPGVLSWILRWFWLSWWFPVHEEVTPLGDTCKIYVMIKYSSILTKSKVSVNNSSNRRFNYKNKNFFCEIIFLIPCIFNVKPFSWNTQKR